MHKFQLKFNIINIVNKHIAFIPVEINSKIIKTKINNGNSILKKLYTSFTKIRMYIKAFAKYEEAHEILARNLFKADIFISCVSSCIALDLPVTHRVHVVQV